MLLKRLVLFLILFSLLSACFQTSPPPAPDAETPRPVAMITLNPHPTRTPFSPNPTATHTQTPPTATPVTPTPLPTEETYGPSDFPPDINPLTGLRVEDPEILDRRPVAVKVNIVPRRNTRPPWGLSLADIVYEFYQNDGYARFHAIFLSQDASMVGPIRSARMLDDTLVRMYKSIFSYGGADRKIDTVLLRSEYSNRLIRETGSRRICPPNSTKPLCRFDPGGNDFLLGGTLEMHQHVRGNGVSDIAQNLDGMYFHTSPPEGGLEGEALITHYSIDCYNRWEYDQQGGNYLRFQDNLLLNRGQAEDFVPLTDRLTEEQITAENIVILFATHQYVQQPPAEIVEIGLKGTGKAYAFRDGFAYELRWHHDDPDKVLYLTFPDGQLYPFKPGKTYFQIVGINSTVSHQEGNSWRFDFILR
jgi:hypothetical protein